VTNLKTVQHVFDANRLRYDFPYSNVELPVDLRPLLITNNTKGAMIEVLPLYFGEVITDGVIDKHLHALFKVTFHTFL
jgi:hypothetical protein